jgi:hypothetical protein
MMRSTQHLLWVFSFVFCVLASSVVVSCKQTHSPMVQHPHLLPGLWESTGNIRLFEEWWLPDDSTLVGRSFSVNGTDTLLLETMELSQRSGQWTFWATPVTQNQGGRSIPFRSTDATDSMVFENPGHDYPNRIVYRLQADTLLHTRTENMAGNKPKTFTFRKIGCTRF